MSLLFKISVTQNNIATKNSSPSNHKNTFMDEKDCRIDNVLVKTIQQIEDIKNRQDDFTGVPTGFPSLDKLTYGWQNTDLIVLAARPSVGKTAFALNLAINAALHYSRPTVVGIFSLEMNSTQIMHRILSAQSEIWHEKIARGKLEEHEFRKLYKSGIEPLSKAPIYIDDSGLLNIVDLKNKCRNLKKEYNVGLIIIDYLQLMSDVKDENNREQEISRITRELKGLAKELFTPIIVISQLSRDVEKRNFSNKIPQLSDLRDSGSIEENADIVLFMYRPEYYDITSNEMGESNKGETYIKIAKHRNGELDTIKLRALLHIQKFIEDEIDSSFSSVLSNNHNSKPEKGLDTSWKNAKLFVHSNSEMKNNDQFDDAPF